MYSPPDRGNVDTSCEYVNARISAATPPTMIGM